MLTDHEVIAQYNSGDQQAFDEIVRRYGQRLRCHFRKMMWHVSVDQREDTIEDMLQETWLRVVRYTPRIDPTFKFSSWIYTVATNVARNHRRGHQRRRKEQRMPVAVHHEDGSSTEVELEFADTRTASRPDLVCEQRDLFDRVMEDLRLKVSPEQLETFTLREVDGLSYEEIAVRLGVQLGTVKSRIHRVHNHTRAFRARYGGN